MSDFLRLRRIVSSWTGNYFGNEDDKQFYDASMILTHQGFQIRPETLAWLLAEEIRKEDYLQDIYVAEKELRMDLVENFNEIKSSLNPKVYEEDGKITFTITDGKEEIIYAEYSLPPALAAGTFKPKEDKSAPAADNAGHRAIDVEIE